MRRGADNGDGGGASGCGQWHRRPRLWEVVRASPPVDSGTGVPPVKSGSGLPARDPQHRRGTTVPAKFSARPGIPRLTWPHAGRRLIAVPETTPGTPWDARTAHADSRTKRADARTGARDSRPGAPVSRPAGRVTSSVQPISNPRAPNTKPGRRNSTPAASEGSLKHCDQAAIRRDHSAAR